MMYCITFIFALLLTVFSDAAELTKEKALKPTRTRVKSSNLEKKTRVPSNRKMLEMTESSDSDEEIDFSRDSSLGKVQDNSTEPVVSLTILPECVSNPKSHALFLPQKRDLHTSLKHTVQDSSHSREPSQITFSFRDLNKNLIEEEEEDLEYSSEDLIGEENGEELQKRRRVSQDKISDLAEFLMEFEENLNNRIFGKMTSKDDINSRNFLIGRDILPERNREYYGELNVLARNTRNKDLEAIKEIQIIVNNPKEHIKDTNIRARAKLYDGSLRGCGEDEAFRTAATYEFLKRSAGLVDGVTPLSQLSNGSEYTWLDAQRDIRFSTAIVLFLNGNGHVGSLYKQPYLKKGNPSLKGQLTIGGKDFHDARHAEILRSSTPISATARAIRFMIDNTPTTSEFLSGEMYDKDTYTIFGENLKTLEGRFSFVNELVVFRNRLKLVFEQYKEYLKNECTTQTEAPTLRDAETYMFSQMDNLEQRLIKLEDLGSPPVND